MVRTWHCIKTISIFIITWLTWELKGFKNMHTSNTNTGLTAAAYARYSTDMQTENSILYQLEAIQKYSMENNITITHVFQDEGKSGTNTDRDGFNGLLAAAKRGEFKNIIIYDVSRGSRDVGDWFNFRKEMLLLGVNVISCKQKLGNLLNGSDFLNELITVGLGQHQVLDIRQKSIDGVAVKAKQGMFLGGIAPYGYTISDGRYIINEYEAVAIRKIFNMYDEGYSYAAILSELKDYKTQRGNNFSQTTVHSILKNIRYTGVYVWNGRKCKVLRKWAGGAPNPNATVIDGAIPAIIDKDLFERVQTKMSVNKTRNASKKAKKTYLLSGLIVCEQCGSNYVAGTSTNSRGSYVYYRCSRKHNHKGGESCPSKNINGASLEAFIVANLKSYLKETNFDDIANYIASQVNASMCDVSKEKKELQDINAKINNGVNAILNGMDMPELKDEIDRLRVRKSELEDIISTAEVQKRQLDPTKLVEYFKVSADELDTCTPEQLRTIINQHVSKIIAHVDGSVTVNIGISLNHKKSPTKNVGDTNNSESVQYLLSTTKNEFVKTELVFFSFVYYPTAAPATKKP